MCPAYKRQHWVPYSYLKGFASSSFPITRKKSKFYKFDGKAESLVRIEPQCRSSYHYSKKDPKGAETGFYKFENDYLSLKDKLLAGTTLTDKEHWILTSNLITLHFRNAAYSNKTGDENEARVVQVIKNYVVQELIGANKKAIFNWKNTLVKTDTDPFITSDHPVLFLYLQSSPLMLILTINPENIILSFDQTKIRPTSTIIQIQDVGKINGLLAMQCIRSVFSSTSFPKSEIPKYTEILTKGKRKNRGWSDKNQLSMEQIQYDESTKNNFSFLKLID